MIAYYAYGSEGRRPHALSPHAHERSHTFLYSTCSLFSQRSTVYVGGLRADGKHLFGGEINIIVATVFIVSKSSRDYCSFTTL